MLELGRFSLSLVEVVEMLFLFRFYDFSIIVDGCIFFAIVFGECSECFTTSPVPYTCVPPLV